MRGPPPKPTYLRILEGNPSKRPLNRNEPQPPPVETLDPPITSAAMRLLSGAGSCQA